MRGTLGALLYLRVTSLRNAVASRFKRLKQPKYLVGAVVGVAYFYLVLFRRFTAPPPGNGPLAQPIPAEQLPDVVAGGAVILTILVALYWLWPRTRAALTFSEAEIAFLFPAPIGRKTLIHFRTINAQLRILFTSLILALVSSRWSFVPGGAGIRIFGWWLILATLDLHAVGSSFVITRLLDRGITSLRRQLLTVAIAALVVGLALVAAWRGLRAPQPENLASPVAVVRYLHSLLTSGALSWLLLPATWVIRPLLATGAREFFAALGPALLIYALHYAWVLRSEVSFEEASIAKAEKRAARWAAARSDGTPSNWRTERKAQRAPFALSEAGRPELAFLWKNLLASASYLRPRVALIAAAVIVVGCSWLARTDHEVLRSVVSGFALAGAGYTLVFGPMFARQDLRLDLPNTDVLKTYPLRGWQVVLGEVLTPVAIITVLLWLLLLAAALTLQPPPNAALTPGLRTTAALGVALLLPFVSAIEVLVMNSAVVLFPAWLPQGPGRGSGIDVLGQRIFFLAGLFLAIAGALLPAAIGAAALFFGTLWIVGAPVAAALGAIAALAVLCVEIGLVVAFIGRRFETFDISAELRP
ncbi:MAG TPA: putative ABC exporter domain-containing protein [Gammaproteobacteria bacterium]|nr:putative ABC exporter domain-containing protein [Gammaproteobacteria bacterium]